MGMVDEPGCFLMAVTARCAECEAESYATVVVKMEKRTIPVKRSPTSFVVKSTNMVDGWGIRNPKTAPVPVCPAHKMKGEV